MQSEADILSQFGAIAGAGLPKKDAEVLRLLSRTPRTDIGSLKVRRISQGCPICG